jgi:hypothetical protein
MTNALRLNSRYIRSHTEICQIYPCPEIEIKIYPIALILPWNFVEYCHEISWNIAMKLHGVLPWNFVEYCHELSWNIAMNFRGILPWNFVEYCHEISWNIAMKYIHESWDNSWGKWWDKWWGNSWDNSWDKSWDNSWDKSWDNSWDKSWDNSCSARSTVAPLAIQAEQRAASLI